MSSTDTTAVVTRIWADVLGPEAAATPGTFFDLRGDSITAIQLVARLSDELGVDIDVVDIFEEDPDLAALLSDVTARLA